MHVPVLLKEVLGVFDPQPGQTYIDAAINGGGHALAILERVGSRGKLLGIDWDCELLEKIKDKGQRKKANNLILECDNYAHIKSIARKYNLDEVSGILFDLGFSSHHLEESGRGFSFLRDEPLDMRYSQKDDILTAEKIINTWPGEAIENTLWDYGEERFARRIAEGILWARRCKKISSTGELVEIISRSVPKSYLSGRIHPATRTFQALRIAVNQELKNLSAALEGAASIVGAQGKIAVIAFHSLEDRIVKNFLKDKEKTFRILTKKPLVASREEVGFNPRARSAKLRAAQKI